VKLSDRICSLVEDSQNGLANSDVQGIAELIEREVEAEKEDLLEVCKGFLKMIDDGILQRNTNKDHEPDWAIKALPLVSVLQKAKQAISKAEGRES